MKKGPPYRELIEKNLINNPEWAAYMANEGPMPECHPMVSKFMASFLFYIGEYSRAQEICYKGSIYFEKTAGRSTLETYEVLYLFDSALYRSLAQRNEEALMLWREVIEKRRKISDEILLKQRMAHLWVYEAYALAKLEQYNEVTQPAQKGFTGINKGKSTYKAPHRNSHVYGLADVIISLANYRIEPNREHEQRAQKTLLAYKKENRRYGRLGYDVIFDLQFSYPDLFEPILPSKNPNED